jgi:hypothetical protein
MPGLELFAGCCPTAGKAKVVKSPTNKQAVKPLRNFACSLANFAVSIERPTAKDAKYAQRAAK